MLPVLQEVAQTVTGIAREQLLPRFNRIGHSHKADGSLLTEADLAAQRGLQQALQAHWPDYAFLAEEMTPAEQAALFTQSAAGLWCLDPLDGTSNFAAGIPYFAVSLALLVDGVPALGVVYDPVRDECFTAERGKGAWLNGEALVGEWPHSALERAIAIVDLKRLEPHLATRLAADHPYSSQRNFGASALDWCWLAAGRGHIYLHGCQRLWDYAAGSLILAEAGGRACSLDGAGFERFTLEPRSVMAALGEELFAAWADYLKVPRNHWGG